MMYINTYNVITRTIHVPIITQVASPLPYVPEGNWEEGPIEQEGVFEKCEDACLSTVGFAGWGAVTEAGKGGEKLWNHAKQTGDAIDQHCCEESVPGLHVWQGGRDGQEREFLTLEKDAHRATTQVRLQYSTHAGFSSLAWP